MFNEAFWFMYILDLLDAIVSFAILGTMVAVIFAFAYGAYIDGIDDTDEGWKRWWLRVRMAGAAAVFLIIISLLAPTPRTMYAGAGQYVAETTEIDDTLIGLKTLIDQKIAEELEK